MVKIRLSREGKKNDPFYRIIAIDESRKTRGQNLAVFGYWHPKTDVHKINAKEIQSWVSRGAQISPAVADLLKK